MVTWTIIAISGAYEPPEAESSVQITWNTLNTFRIRTMGNTLCGSIVLIAMAIIIL